MLDFAMKLCSPILNISSHVDAIVTIHDLCVVRWEVAKVQIGVGLCWSDGTQ
jgi:hypothetical protein